MREDLSTRQEDVTHCNGGGPSGDKLRLTSDFWQSWISKRDEAPNVGALKLLWRAPSPAVVQRYGAAEAFQPGAPSVPASSRTPLSPARAAPLGLAAGRRRRQRAQGSYTAARGSGWSSSHTPGTESSRNEVLSRLGTSHGFVVLARGVIAPSCSSLSQPGRAAETCGLRASGSRAGAIPRPPAGRQRWKGSCSALLRLQPERFRSKPELFLEQNRVSL